MTQRLCIGFQKLNSSWEAILNDLGVWFEHIDYGNDLHSQYSLIVLNDMPDNSQMPLLKNYLTEGGALLDLKDVHAFKVKNTFRSTFERTVIDRSKSEVFKHIPFLDLFSTIEVHQESDLFNGMIHFDKFGKGVIGFFGADISNLLNSTQYKRKRFYAGNLPSPDEIVSTVSKHELIEVFRSTIAHLHFERNLPFIQKWTSPTEKPVFCFRIDSDFGDRASIENLYNICSKHDIKATWFLHVEAHENWLNVFPDLEQQEIALHGYKHGTTRSSFKAVANINKGRELLESSGMEVTGYCAPYGIWNDALEKALEDFELDYTSEFTFKYDGFPVTSPADQSRLQIPIHPICTGSLNRRHYTVDQMKRYFRDLLEGKSARYEPILFYHHPLQPGLNVIEYVFEEINQQGLENLTFSEYADFWFRRRNNRFEAFYDGNELMVDSDTNLILQASTGHEGFHLLNSEEDRYDLKTIPKIEYRSRYLPTPEKIEEMRETDLRLLKTSLWDWKNRIRL